MNASVIELLGSASASARPGTMKHTISVLVDNAPGVLIKVGGLFRRRG